MMRYGSVCSGIEAASVAWHGLGWRPSFFADIAPFPRAVLSHRFPSVPLRGDFTEIQSGDHEPIDLLVGGTPCQSFSLAGLRGGLADGRGNLALEYLRLADRLGPRWLLWENVPGVLSSNGGRDFGSILGGLVELGYGFAYRVLDAQYFGVPQRRQRVFVVGYLGDWRRAAAVLFEPESLRRDHPPRRAPGQDTSPCLSARASAGGGLGTDHDLNGGLIQAFGGNNQSGPIDVATALNACPTASGRQDFETETFVAHTLRGEGFDASEDGTGRGIPLVAGTLLHGRRAAGSATTQDALNGLLIPFDTTQVTSVANRSRCLPGAPSHALSRSSAPPAIAFDCKSSGQNGFGVGEVAGTMRAMGHADGHQNGGGHQAVCERGEVRRLTPLECERLQGFPDGWTRIPTRTYRQRKLTRLRPADRWEPAEDGGWMLMAPDGPRYKALGNSMAVPVMRWIGERIQQVEMAA